MKKRTFSLLLIFAVFLLPLTQAINLDVEKQSSNEVMILGINDPAIFSLKIKNLGEGNNFQFYNLLGFSMAPKGTVYFNQGDEKNIELMIFPREDFNFKGLYTFKYFIRGEDGDEISKKLTLNVMNLEDVFEIGSGEINPESNSLEIYIENNADFNFDLVDAKFKSAFFEFEETFSLNPKERKNFEIILEKEDFEKLVAGFYTLSSEVNVDGKKIDLENVIKFVEKGILTTSKKDYGLLINTQLIEKKNDGNTITGTETIIKKNIISRLFTNFSPEPDIVEREGFNVNYTWVNELSPGEILKITVKTNWLFPLFVILFLVLAVVLAKQYSRTDIEMRKKVSFVRTKGGEFALKVTIFIKAKKYVERVNIMDRLPNLVKIHEKFGGEKPKRINEKTKRIEWDFEKLEIGETRILSYIIYSKIGILGKFALPTATAIYEKEGKIHETESNKAFFIAEQGKKKEDE